MRMNVFVLLLCIFLQVQLLTATETPIFGVLSQEPFSIQKYFPNLDISSYVAASYVKFLESAGARVIPVWIGQNEQYYKRVVKYTNGMLFPGGATYFDHPNGYGDAAKMIYAITLEYNQMGIYYPLIGICLGMEVLATASADGKDIRVGCEARKVALPLELDPQYKESRILKNLPNDILSDLETKNVTYHYHKYCLTDEVIKENNLTDVWGIFARNDDINGKKFISIMEHKKYPIYGLQFHPEKVKFEFGENSKIPHDVSSGRVSQYFADFIVGESRKNDNTFPDKNIEHESLIYNFNAVLSPLNCTYLQLYLFNGNESIHCQLDK